MAKKKQPARSILISFVLDKSGSMESMREAAIQGFNEFKASQAEEDGNALLTLTMFDTRFDHLCRAVPLREVPDLDRPPTAPTGCTALYDALAHTIREADDIVAAERTSTRCSSSC